MTLLGKLIRLARIERKLTAQDLAERAGISRALLHRIERGDPKCSIGAVFEVAAILGVPLFQVDHGRLDRRLEEVDGRLALLPEAVRTRQAPVRDDF
ncbi:helix-turn-helix transcriptional regulator [Xanthobacter pseudotagetidis]|uniref:helix-turn-helix transcriptional regulator n=1 Tax=Xanthobacter pseudotagetidis TaxID=3119911 RepID=UPI003728DEAA